MLNLFHNKIKLKAISIIEVLLASAIVGIVVSAIVIGLSYSQENSVISGKQTQALSYGAEGLEALRNIRDENFNSLTNGTHGLMISGNQWILSGTQDTLNGFTRSVEITALDAGTKIAVVTISWQQNLQRAGSITISTYLSNWEQLVPSISDWTSPDVESTLDLLGSGNGYKVEVDGKYAYLVRQSTDPDLEIIDISEPSDPVSVGQIALTGNINDLSVFGKYIAVASSDDDNELQIIDISFKTTPLKIGSFDASGTADIRGVEVSGNYAYLVRSSSTEDEFLAVDISVPDSPVFSGSANLGDTPRDIKTIENFAYIASYQNDQELQVVDINNPSSPALIGSYDLPADDNALTINGFSNFIFIGRENGEFISFDVTFPNTPSPIGTYDALARVNGIALNNTNSLVFLAVSSGDVEFQVLDVSTPSQISLIGSFDAPAELGGVIYDSTTDRAIAVGNSDLQEFVIYKPN